VSLLFDIFIPNLRAKLRKKFDSSKKKAQKCVFLSTIARFISILAQNATFSSLQAQISSAPLKLTKTGKTLLNGLELLLLAANSL